MSLESRVGGSLERVASAYTAMQMMPDAGLNALRWFKAHKPDLL